MKRHSGFVCSWFFAPYLGSADLDLFKRLKDTPFDYRVVQVRRAQKDEAVLRFATRANFERVEIATRNHEQPRTREVRDQFIAGALEEFERSPDRFDFLLSHSNEVPSHDAAYRIKQRYPRLPWIAYFGDVVSKNPYVRYLSSYPLNDEDIETEARTLRCADVVVLNNEFQRDLMFSGPLAAYAEKAVVIPHCFDPAMYPAESPGANDRFTFMHLGTLYPVKRTAESLLRGIDRLIEVYPAYRNRFEVRFYGAAASQQDRITYAGMRNPSHVRFEEPVGYLESLAKMREADALVLIDGIFNEAEDGLSFNPFFPGKLTDYMGARRPILGITMPRGPSAGILAESANLLAGSATDRIAYVLKRYIDRKVMPRFEAFDRFGCTAVALEMERVIRWAVGSSTREVPAPAA